MSFSSSSAPSPPTPAAGSVGALVVAGVSGSGKSTVGLIVAKRLGWVFVDGDDLHPWRNVYAMHHGRPLTDADRDPWLERCADLLENHVRTGVPVVLACSALKAKYRRRLRRDAATLLVHLACSRAELERRLRGRENHFFDPALLDSQFAALEPVGPGEGAVIVDGDESPNEIANDIVRLITTPAQRAEMERDGYRTILPAGGEASPAGSVLRGPSAR